MSIFAEATPCCANPYPECGQPCNADERAVRRYINGDEMPPITYDQREEMLAEGSHAYEGSSSREEAKNLPDKELAAWLLQGWAEYVSSHF